MEELVLDALCWTQEKMNWMLQSIDWSGSKAYQVSTLQTVDVELVVLELEFDPYLALYVRAVGAGSVAVGIVIVVEHDWREKSKS